MKTPPEDGRRFPLEDADAGAALIEEEETA
jgi:hypothetical protein